MKQTDFTEGKVRGVLLKFFFPMLLANILQQAYSFADMVIIGKCIGDNALAAVGNFTTISFFITGFAAGITNGFAVNISQAYGSKDSLLLKKALAASVKLSGLIAVILTFTGVLFLQNILVLMKTDKLILSDSMDYGYIIFAGLIATVAYNLFSSILRAFGDSKTPFLAICISAVLNIILDFVTIYIFDMGVSGPAFATVFAQGVSAVICFYRLRKTGNMKLCKSDFKRNIRLSAELLKNGVPMAFMNSVTSVGCIFVQGCVNGYGVVYTSAYSACNKYVNLFMLPGITSGFAVSSFTGQNFGAGKFLRIHDGVKFSCAIAIVSAVLLGVVMFVFPTELAEIMLTGSEAIEYTASFLRTFAVMLVLLNLFFVFRSCVQGLGKPLVPMLSGFVEMLLRIPTIFIGFKIIGFDAAAYAEGIAWIGALMMNVGAYVVWRKRV